MKVVSITAASEHNTERALEVLDSLRAAIASGDYVAFAAVALNADDETARWCAATRDVSRLRMMGAIADLQHWYIEDA